MRKTIYRSILETPSARHRNEFLAAVAASRQLHHPWVSTPATPKAYDAYLQRLRAPTHAGYFVRTESKALAGAINISEIVLGAFRSGYLGYYAFAPHHRQGYMTLGLEAVLRDAFRALKLHRLEANIQPQNEASRRLVRRLGFRLEGFSPRYLKIGGRWRDHERWALTVEEWTPKHRPIKAQ